MLLGSHPKSATATLDGCNSSFHRHTPPGKKHSTMKWIELHEIWFIRFHKPVSLRLHVYLLCFSPLSHRKKKEKKYPRKEEPKTFFHMFAVHTSINIRARAKGWAEKIINFVFDIHSHVELDESSLGERRSMECTKYLDITKTTAHTPARLAIPLDESGGEGKIVLLPYSKHPWGMLLINFQPDIPPDTEKSPKTRENLLHRR